MKFKNFILRTAGCMALAFAAFPAGTQTLTTGAFPNPAPIESQLKRGVSSKADVQRLLGIPGGTGRGDMARPATLGAPLLGDGAREIWFYDDIEVTDMKSGEGAMRLSLRQQILLVFFKGDVFDGYLWTTNALAGTAR